MNITIRPAAADDMAAVNDIRNHYVRTSTAIYTDAESSPAERMQWFRERDTLLHPITVACRGGEVVGWGSLSSFSDKCGYRLTLENSVYVRAGEFRQGIGRLLLDDLIQRAAAAGAHTIIARVDSEQIPSLRLHENSGFFEAGRLKEAGFKFGRWLDVIYLQKLLAG
jgi:phosphinothricin acetyltransferase